MTNELRIRGQWPSPITMSRNWARAHARPWNDETPESFVRLERGGVGFLREVSDRLVDISGRDVYSPAVFGDSTRIWERSGFRPEFELDMMEKSLGRVGPSPGTVVNESSSPDWNRLLAIDSAAFPSFWRMSVAGLIEAANSAPNTSTLTVVDDDRVVGYAVVGIQWSVAYLQRIAVHPDCAGRGYGSDLLRAAALWGRRNGAPVMILNVRPSNSRAIAVYEREGFTRTGTSLSVLRYAA